MLEIKYINLLSNKLKNFRRKSGNIFNFSCPICGDSTTHKNKARGYVYHKTGNWLYHCHNCNVTMSVVNFIKHIDPLLHKDMLLEHIKNNKTPEQIELERFTSTLKKPKYMSSHVLKGLKKVSQLNSEHPIKKFIDSRKIPNPYHAKLFACPNFMNFTNSIIPNKFEEKVLKHDEARLLIPFINSDGIVHGYQGRSIRSKSEVKYITIIIDDSIPRIYGLDTVNFNDTVFVFEGPIDSMFIKNSIATAGGDLVSSIGLYDKNNLVVVYDNEPRSVDTIKKIDKAITMGYNVCIWPNDIEHKDINDMILNNYTVSSIEHILQKNVYKGLSAKLALSKWRKI